MKTIKNIPQIKTTSQYDMFTSLEGNRSVRDGRKDKIIKSIRRIGYIPVPIVVNEKMEVIDGQGRLEVLKELGFPVCYIIVPGLTIEHCVAMNINQTNWTMMDYIESYAHQGNENYKRLLTLLSSHESLGFRAISALITGNVQGADNSTIKNGELKAPQDRMEYAERTCVWLEANVLPLKSKIGGRFDHLLYAIMFCLEHTEVDKNRLAEVIRSNVYDIMPPATTLSALKEIERIYNYRLSTKKIYFTTEYDKFLTANRWGYGGRWSIKAREAKEAPHETV